VAGLVVIPLVAVAPPIPIREVIDMGMEAQFTCQLLSAALTTFQLLIVTTTCTLTMETETARNASPAI